MKKTPTYTLSLFALLAFCIATGPALACSNDSDSTQAETPSNAPQPDPTPTQPSETIDPTSFPEVVARITSTEITRTELIERANAVRARLQIDASGLDFYQKVLEEMVGMELLHQAASDKGYAPTEAELNSQIDTIRSRFPGEAEFTQQLTSQGLTLEKLRQMMTKDMSIEKFVTTEIAPRATVSEEQKKNFYNENSEDMKRPEQARLSHILVKVDEGSPPEAREQAKKKAEDLRQRLATGEDFAGLARESSDDPGSKAQGGDLAWVSRGQTVPAFEQAAFALQPNQLSDVVETPFGFHIIKLTERKPAETMPYEEVKDRIAQFLNQQRLQEEVQAEVERLKANTPVQVFI